MHRTRLLAFLVVLALCAQAALACSIPVFRYAAEFWTPDPYHLHLFHDRPLDEAQEALVRQLEEGPKPVNLVVVRHDVTGELGPEAAALLKAFAPESYPHLMLQLPRVSGSLAPIWTGPLTSQNVTDLATSPVRTRLVEELAERSSVVWLYLECGDKERDDRLFALLQYELERLESILELPELTEEDREMLKGDLTLQLSVVRVSRTDPAEAALVEMLLSTEPDLRDPEFVGEPMAFPVFGRGRVLYSLAGAGISPATIEEACRFLTGACQCTVKLQNPGADLLLSAAWNQEAGPIEPEYVSIPGTSNPTIRNSVAAPGGASARPAAPTDTPVTPLETRRAALTPASSEDQVRPGAASAAESGAAFGLTGGLKVAVLVGAVALLAFVGLLRAR